MSLELKNRLTAELAPEVEELAALLGKDLSQWSEPIPSMGRKPPELANIQPIPSDSGSLHPPLS